MHVDVFLDLLPVLGKSIFLLLGEILAVTNRYFFNLFLGYDSHLDEVLLDIEELICDLMVAFIEWSHEAWKDTELTWPCFSKAERFLGLLTGAFEDSDELSYNKNTSNQVASHVWRINIGKSFILWADLWQLTSRAFFKLKELNKVNFLESWFLSFWEDIR